MAAISTWNPEPKKRLGIGGRPCMQGWRGAVGGSGGVGCLGSVTPTRSATLSLTPAMPRSVPGEAQISSILCLPAPAAIFLLTTLSDQPTAREAVG